MNRVEIAKKFDAAIKGSGMTHGEIAKRASVPAHAVAQSRNPKGAQGSMKRLESLASVLGITLSEEKPVHNTPTPHSNGVDSEGHFLRAASELAQLPPDDRRRSLVRLVQIFGEANN